jgi:predicted PurR-regulated permease PerM
MIAGLISFVPYLGAITGVIMAIVAALVQYQDWTHVALVLVVFGIGQTLEGYVLVPKLVGDKIGLHPVAVIFAVLAGGELFGFLGVLLALPVASVLMVLLRYAHERYTASKLYDLQDAPVIVMPDEEPLVTPASVIVTDHVPPDGT